MEVHYRRLLALYAKDPLAGKVLCTQTKHGDLVLTMPVSSDGIQVDCPGCLGLMTDEEKGLALPEMHFGRDEESRVACCGHEVWPILGAYHINYTNPAKTTCPHCISSMTPEERERAITARDRALVDALSKLLYVYTISRDFGDTELATQLSIFREMALERIGTRLGHHADRVRHPEWWRVRKA